MVFDFMQQIMSHLDSLEKKIDGNQQCFEKLSKRIEKRKVIALNMFFHVKLQLLVIPSSCNTYTMKQIRSVYKLLDTYYKNLFNSIGKG